jgi:hypothetical protein
MSGSTRYPRSVDIKDGVARLDLMTPAMEAEVLQFANTLAVHDLLFLRRDITQAKVLSAWANQIQSGEITSLIAREGEQILGCSAVVMDKHSTRNRAGKTHRPNDT